MVRLKMIKSTLITKDTKVVKKIEKKSKETILQEEIVDNDVSKRIRSCRATTEPEIIVPKYSYTDNFLVEMWREKFMERLLKPEIKSLSSSSSSSSSNYNQSQSLDNEVLLSKIGYGVDDNVWFRDINLSKSEDNMICQPCDNVKSEDNNNIIVDIGIKENNTKVDEIKDSDYSINQIDNNEIKNLSNNEDSEKNDKDTGARKNILKQISLSQLCQELTNPNVDPHLLVKPREYSIATSDEDWGNQPFEIKVHPQVPFLCDIHGHLCDSEVIGLLAGKWDEENKCLYIQAPFPCTSTSLDVDDDGSTDVELDPVAEYTVRESIQQLGLQVVGWYHSHPRFRPDPSVTDINNQQQYQLLMKDNRSDIEPFVGLIVSTYDTQLYNAESKHQWFHVKNYQECRDKGDNGTGSRGQKRNVSIPILLKVTVRSIINDKINFIENKISDELFQILCNNINEMNNGMVEEEKNQDNDINDNDDEEKNEQENIIKENVLKVVNNYIINKKKNIVKKIDGRKGNGKKKTNKEKIDEKEENFHNIARKNAKKPSLKGMGGINYICNPLDGIKKYSSDDDGNSENNDNSNDNIDLGLNNINQVYLDPEDSALSIFNRDNSMKESSENIYKDDEYVVNDNNNNKINENFHLISSDFNENFTSDNNTKKLLPTYDSDIINLNKRVSSRIKKVINNDDYEEIFIPDDINKAAIEEALSSFEVDDSNISRRSQRSKTIPSIPPIPTQKPPKPNQYSSQQDKDNWFAYMTIIKNKNSNKSIVVENKASELKNKELTEKLDLDIEMKDEIQKSKRGRKRNEVEKEATEKNVIPVVNEHILIRKSKKIMQKNSKKAEKIANEELSNENVNNDTNKRKINQQSHDINVSISSSIIESTNLIQDDINSRKRKVKPKLFYDEFINDVNREVKVNRGRKLGCSTNLLVETNDDKIINIETKGINCDISVNIISKTLMECTLVKRLQITSSKSSILGRDFICNTIIPYRSIALSIVTMGFYYSAHKHRIDLFNNKKKWKKLVKIEKLKKSCIVWMGSMGYKNEEDKNLFIDKMIEFYRSCWNDE